MVKQCSFDTRNIDQILRESKAIRGDFWSDLNRNTLTLLRQILEGSMETWRDEYVDIGHYERSEEGRKGYRNGYYIRKSWPTPLGPLKNVQVPRCREKGLTGMMKEKVGDGLNQVSDQVIEMFIAGVSTRRVGEILERITGLSVSSGSVSRLAKKLDGSVRTFHHRPLEDKYAYLFLDGIYLKTRAIKPSPFRRKRRKRGKKGKKRVILVAYGITSQGIKELIDFCIVDSESADSCRRFLMHLYNRGLKGENLRLIASDRGGGITSAAEEVYPQTAKQCCWFHKMSNVIKKVKKKDQEEVVAGLRKVYDAKHRRASEKAYRAWKKRWQRKYPDAVKCVEKDIDRLLAFYATPKAHWKMVRTTNAIERCFREVRRRTRSIGTFLDDASISRIIYGLFEYMNRKRANVVCREFRKTKIAA